MILQNGETLKTGSLPAEICLKQSVDTTNSSCYFVLPEEGISLDELEKQLIQQALEMADDNQTKASKLLDISRDTLRYKKKKHKL